MSHRPPLLTGARLVAAVAFVAVSATGLTAVALADPNPRRTRDPIAGGRPVLGPRPVTVELQVRNSHFRPARVRVRPATEVRFVIVNHDPIGHELIVGDAEVHARHATGHEAAHGEVPGEVSIAPGATASTTFAFTDPGRVLFACHLPGHFAYGMKGTVRVVAP